VRGPNGQLENLYIRVSIYYPVLLYTPELSVYRLTARKFFPMAEMLRVNFWLSSKYAKALQMVQVRKNTIPN
jgi:hypothetical protein